jgi:hypothetical protein
MATKLSVGSEVVFKDRFGKPHTGIIKQLHKPGSWDGVGSGWSATIEADGSEYVMPWKNVAAPGTARAEAIYAAPFTFGQVVRVKVTGPRGEYGGIKNGDLAVVLADKPSTNLVNVARLGGTGKDEYGRFPRTSLTLVPVAMLLSGAYMGAMSEAS